MIGIPYPACRTAKTSSERPEVYGNYTSVVRCSQCRVLMSAVQLQNSKNGRPAHAANITGIISTSGRSGDCAPSIQAVTCCYHSAALQSRLNWSHQEQHELQHEAERTQLTPPGRESARETRENFEKNAFERFSKVLEGSNMLQHLICFRHCPFSSFSRF